MNRAERRRQQKKAKKEARNAKPGHGANRSPKQQTPNIQQALDLAVQHHNAGRLPEAEGLYQQILLAHPDHPVALQLLGVIAHQMGKNEQAVASYRKALAIDPDYADAHYNLGNALMDQGKLDDALASYHKALAIKPDYAEVLINLGVALWNLGDLDKAVASFRKALAINPDYAEAHRQLAVIKKFSEYDDDIKAMEEAYARPNISDEQKMHLAFGLGKAFEDLRQYEKAFGFFADGNDIKRGIYDYSMENVEKFFGNLKKLFSKDLFSRNPGAGESDETPIFVLGLPRSGTTLVEQILASHPKVHGAGESDDFSRTVVSRFRELADAKFAGAVNQAGPGDFSAAGSEYIHTMRERSDTARFITDKTPNNFQFIGLIKLMLPNAKVIHCCRDPRDTCLSIFKTLFTDDALFYAYDLGELGRYYNSYRDLMNHWHDVLPNFIYDIQYEEVVADQENQSRALLEHCGLEWDDACLEFHKTNRPVQTASAAQVRQPIYKDSVQSWKRYEKQLAPVLDVLVN